MLVKPPPPDPTLGGGILKEASPAPTRPLVTGISQKANEPFEVFRQQNGSSASSMSDMRFYSQRVLVTASSHPFPAAPQM